MTRPSPHSGRVCPAGGRPPGQPLGPGDLKPSFGTVLSPTRHYVPKSRERPVDDTPTLLIGIVCRPDVTHPL